MNHKLLRMIEKAGFEFTPDVMAKLPEFEKLVGLEREACAKTAMELLFVYIGSYPINEQFADAIRARGQG